MAEFDVQAARKSGYSDDEILQHLTATRSFDVPGALSSGYSKTDVIKHLSDTAASNKVGENSPVIAAPEAASVGGFLRNMVSSGMDQVKNLGNMVAHPIDAVSSLAAIPAGGVIKAARALGAAPSTQGDQLAGAYDAFVNHVKGRYGSADATKNTLYSDPVGALMDVSMLFGGAGAAARGAGAAAEAANLGRVASVARGVASAAKVADPLTVAGRAAGRVVSGVGGALADKAAAAVESSNPMHRGMVDFADQNQIPVSAGVRTGNKFVQGVQAVVDHSPAGAVVAKGAKEAEASALARVGDNLAAKVHPDPISPLQAGTDVKTALETKIGAEHATAGEHYDVIRELEADPANLQNVQVRTKQVPMVDAGGKPTGDFRTEPVMADVSLPVDMRAAKAALKPVYDRMMRQLPVTQQRGSAGLKAIENILQGDDYAPASLVDTDLGTIKGIARGADLPELKNMSQALGAQAIPAIEEAVQAAVAKAKRTDRGGAVAAENADIGNTNGPENRQGATLSNPAGAGTEAGGQGYRGTANTTIEVPGKDVQYPAKYEVRELAELQPSHSGHTFAPNPRYKLRNDRDYNNPESRGKIVEWSTPAQFKAQFHITDNPDALNGPVVIDSGGNVIGGNGRTMILQRVYKGNKQGAQSYRDLLAQKAAMFGADPAAIAGMKEPVLVRVVDDAALAKASDAVSDANVTGTASYTPAERAVADSKRVSAGTLDHMAARLESEGPTATLAEVLKGNGGLQMLGKLVEDGVITTQERAGLADKNGLTKAGKDRVSGLVLGRFFHDPAQLENLAPSLRNKLERIAAPLAKAEGEPGWNLTPHVADAVELLENARAHGGSTVDDFLNQNGLFGAQGYTPQSVQLARAIEGATETQITKAVRQYAHDSDMASKGAGLFGDAPTMADSFVAAFGGDAAEIAAAPATPAARTKTSPQVKAEIPSTPAGDEATAALLEGRAATTRKYEAASVRDNLPNKGAEGRQVFDQAIWQKDAGIEKLRALAKQTPDEIPKLGRAAIEELLTEATAEGGFDRGKTLLSRWQRMGPETKAVLFKSPDLISNLDNFFLLAKKSGENINPSGTAMVTSQLAGLSAMAASPVLGAASIIGSGVLAKMMHSPAAMAALTDGLKVQGGRGVTSALAAARILQQANKSGADLSDDKIKSLAAEFGKDPKGKTQTPVAVGQ